MALQDKLQIDCSVLHVLFATYLATFLGLQRLHRESWCYTMQFYLQLVLQCWKKHIYCKLQVAASSCSLQWVLKKFHAIVTESRTQAQKDARQVTKRVCNTLHYCLTTISTRSAVNFHANFIPLLSPLLF